MKTRTVFFSLIVVTLMSLVATAQAQQYNNLFEMKKCHFFITFYGNPDVGEEAGARLACLGMHKRYDGEYIFFSSGDMRYIYDAVIQVKTANNKYLVIKTANYPGSEVPLKDIEKLYQASCEKDNKVIFNIFNNGRRALQQPRSLDYLVKAVYDLPKVTEVK